jgi:hypothetical protein
MQSGGLGLELSAISEGVDRAISVGFLPSQIQRSIMKNIENREFQGY